MSAHVAIVAGAGGALGHATTATLAAGGLTVVAVDRNEHALRELPNGVGREVADTIDPAAAKSLVHLTRILDIELPRTGFRVNAVAPQLLDTPANRATFPDEAMAHAVAPEAIAGQPGRGRRDRRDARGRVTGRTGPGRVTSRAGPRT